MDATCGMHSSSNAPQAPSATFSSYKSGSGKTWRCRVASTLAAPGCSSCIERRSGTLQALSTARLAAACMQQRGRACMRRRGAPAAAQAETTHGLQARA